MMQAVLSKSQQEESATITQGRSAVKRNFGLKFWLFLVIFMATVLEGIVFNHFYFRFAWGDYQTVSAPLPYNEQLGENAYVFSPQQRVLVLEGLDLELMTVGFKLKGEHTLLSGTLALTDDSSIVAPILANKFKVAPSDIYTSGLSVTEVQAAPYKFLVRSNGKAHSITLSFDQLNGGVILTDLTLNVAPEYYFSWIRWLALTLLGTSMILVWRLRLYRLRIGELSTRAFRIVQGLSLALCLTLSLSYSYLLLPSHISPNLLFDYTEHGFIYLGNPKQSLLLDFPHTSQELEYHDAYVQNLDAWLKGQLNIDVIIDTDVLNAAHDERLYDYGWRAQNGIEGFWDRCFYDNKVYAYYGSGPVVLFYLPLYLLTGKAPSPTLALTFFSVVAILGLYLGTYALARFYGVLPRANALIWSLGQAAAVLGTHLVLVQCMMWFYSYGSLLCMALLGLLTYLAYSVPLLATTRNKRLFLVAMGLVIVLIVQTRPHMLIPAMILVAPILWGLVRAAHFLPNLGKTSAGEDSSSVAYTRHDKLLDVICLAVPLVLGAALTMTLNYLRFDSIFEFGQRFSLSSANLLFDQMDVNLELISAALEQFVTRSWVDLVDFPYFGIMTEAPHHVGTFLLTQSSVGILASPVWWGLGLVFLLWMPNQMGGAEEPTPYLSTNNRYALNQRLMLQVSLVSLILVMLAMCFGQFTVVTVTVRYLMENLAPLVGFLVVLWVKFISYDSSAPLQAKLCYWAVVWGLGMTLVMDGLAPFSEIEQYRPYLIPDEWLKAQSFFMPLSTVH